MFKIWSMTNIYIKKSLYLVNRLDSRRLAFVSDGETVRLSDPESAETGSALRSFCQIVKAAHRRLKEVKSLYLRGF